MVRQFYETFDHGWIEASLFRDLLLVDTEELAAFVRYHRPLHVAFADIDPFLQDDARDGLKVILAMISPNGAGHYARVILMSEAEAHVWEAVVAHLADHYSDLLRCRRVFCARARPTDQGVDRMYRAIGSAQAVYLQDGVWRVPELL